MSQTPVRSRRSQSLECCRMLAAFFVVIIHTTFPGAMQEIVNCVGRFAMPLFFGITGYFCFGAGSEKLSRRVFSILRLNIIASAASLLLNTLVAVSQGEALFSYLRRALPGMRGLSNWLFLSVNPFGAHLWFLAALAIALCLLWAYVRFFPEGKIDYRPLYAACAALLFVRFAATDLMRSIGIDIPYYLCRDGLFMGLPLVGMGLFLRQYRDRLISAFSLTPGKLLRLFAAGTLLSLIQMAGIGTGELPFGALLQGAAMLLLCSMCPDVFSPGSAGEKAVGAFGFLSTAVYIVHLAMIDAYSAFLLLGMGALLGALEPWLRPLIVFALSLVFSILIRAVVTAAGRLRRRA